MEPERREAFIVAGALLLCLGALLAGGPIDIEEPQQPVPPNVQMCLDRGGIPIYGGFGGLRDCVLGRQLVSGA